MALSYTSVIKELPCAGRLYCSCHTRAFLRRSGAARCTKTVQGLVSWQRRCDIARPFTMSRGDSLVSRYSVLTLVGANMIGIQRWICFGSCTALSDVPVCTQGAGAERVSGISPASSYERCFFPYPSTCLIQYNADLGVGRTTAASIFLGFRPGKAGLVESRQRFIGCFRRHHTISD